MRRRKALVTQHLEGISRDAIEKYQHIVQGYVRRRQGVYALYRRGNLYYVGLAGNLRSRLRQHLKDRHRVKWDRFSVYLTIGDQHLKELETLVLQIVSPTGNVQRGRFIKSENLLRRFRRDLREDHRRENAFIIGARESSRPPQGDDRRASSTGGGRVPVLARHLESGIVIRARYKGKWIVARVRRNGTIKLGGRVFTSPSLAGRAATGRVSCNGWKFWKYERSPGDWVLLHNLRK